MNDPNTHYPPQNSDDSDPDIIGLRKTILKNLNHEIRTPLTSILGFSEILSDLLKDTEYYGIVTKIFDAGSRLQNTLNSLIILSELENLSANVPQKRFNVCEETKQMVDQFKNIAERKKLLLVFYAKEPCFCIGSPRLFGQIVENLLDNAIKFTPQGTVKVEISPVTEDNLEWILISFKDTGIGIADEHKSLIFQEFRQVSEGDRRNYEGFGIGLNICKNLIDIMGGKLSLKSSQGKGSTFNVLLPMVSAAEDIRIEEFHIVSHHYGRPMLLHKFNGTDGELPLLLLVEDNSTNVELITLYLKGICNVVHAFDGYSAIKLASENRFDIVLMDINLGIGINGIETLQSLRNINGYSEVPMIAITGYTDSEDEINLLAKGFSSYLPKPFDKAGLFLTIKENLFD